MKRLLAGMLIANGRRVRLSECTFEMPAQIMPCVAGITAATVQGLARACPGTALCALLKASALYHSYI